MRGDGELLRHLVYAHLSQEFSVKDEKESTRHPFSMLADGCSDGESRANARTCSHCLDVSVPQLQENILNLSR